MPHSEALEMNAQEMLEKFEKFLGGIPLDWYREELMTVKTVEQNLSKELNPLPFIYKYYWIPQNPSNFPSYEDFFTQWWEEHLNPLDDFISKYLWGCSYQFVKLGFKARIYRTFISVLTQFHFAYTWLAHCKQPLEASAELDMKGIDALVKFQDAEVALQVKKQTYRSEARGAGRFAKRAPQAQLTVEVPYTLIRGSMKKRTGKQEEKKEHKLLRNLAKDFQNWLPNGFVVFKPEYPLYVEQLVDAKVKNKVEGIISWNELLDSYLTSKSKKSKTPANSPNASTPSC